METLTIGQVARQAGVNVETIRYYERRALLTRPSRAGSDYRQYPVEAVRRIAFIKRAQAVGFTLDEIAALLALRATTPKGCAAVEREASAVIQRIDQTVAELTRMRAALGHLIQACRSQRPTDECPLLEALESDGVTQ
jgi:Hg(II)-responsive transcriptional regulator